MKKGHILLFTVLVLVLSVSCGVNSEPALTITGLKDLSFNQRSLETMTMINSHYINKDGETNTYSGISIGDLLADQRIESYTQLNIIASDGYSAAVTFDELTNCPECVLSYSTDNGWSAVMPGFSGKLQVIGVVELNIE